MTIPPRGWQRLMLLGPGFLWMVSAAGSGELLFTSRVGALHGYSLLWAMLGAVALKWFILPMYEEFFRAVRDVNRGLPRERHIRVLLGEVPINWDEVQSYTDIVKLEEQRETHTAALIRREVLAKGRHVLVLYGEMHAQRRNERTTLREQT